MEIGSGTGLNLPHYPDDLDELVLIEPDAAMRSASSSACVASGRRARSWTRRRSGCPFADGSVDTVVSTFVLCTVDAPDLALREIARVLRPDGQLLFIEHVRSDVARRRLLAGPAGGTVASLREGLSLQPGDRGADRRPAGLALDDVREASWRGMPPIVRPLIVGHARTEAT